MKTVEKEKEKKKVFSCSGFAFLKFHDIKKCVTETFVFCLFVLVRARPWLFALTAHEEPEIDWLVT